MSLADVLKSLEEKISFKKEAVIGGIRFEISPVSYEQDQAVNSLPEEGESPLTYYEKTRTQILAYAIKKVDGEEIPDIVQVVAGDKTETKERSIYMKEIIKKLPPKIVEKLFEIYIDFKEEVDNRLNDGVEYKWYKTPEERKAEREKNAKEAEKEEEVGKGVEVPSGEEDQPIVFTEVKDTEEPVA